MSQGFISIVDVESRHAVRVDVGGECEWVAWHPSSRFLTVETGLRDCIIDVAKARVTVDLPDVGHDPEWSAWGTHLAGKPHD